MEETKTNTLQDKIFLGFGVITILSGIFLIIEKDYLMGVSGTAVGIWLVSHCLNTIKEKKKS